VPPQALWIFNEFSIYLRASRGKIFRVLFIQTLDHHQVAFLGPTLGHGHVEMRWHVVYFISPTVREAVD